MLRDQIEYKNCIYLFFLPIFALTQHTYADTKNSLSVCICNCNVILNICVSDTEMELHHSSRWICGAAKNSNVHLFCEMAAGWAVSHGLPETCESNWCHDWGMRWFFVSAGLAVFQDIVWFQWCVFNRGWKVRVEPPLAAWTWSWSGSPCGSLTPIRQYSWKYWNTWSCCSTCWAGKTTTWRSMRPTPSFPTSYWRCANDLLCHP